MTCSHCDAPAAYVYVGPPDAPGGAACAAHAPEHERAHLQTQHSFEKYGVDEYRKLRQEARQ